jgi:hypothetical protein
MAFQPGDMNKILMERGSNKSDFGAPPGSVSGSPVAAKLSAKQWKLKQPQTDKVTPAPFEVERAMNPGKYRKWGDEFLTTSAATEFVAPLPEPAPTTKETA